MSDAKIMADQSDIVIGDDYKRNNFLNEVLAQTDDNVSPKETQKLSKYKNLRINLSYFWDRKQPS